MFQRCHIREKVAPAPCFVQVLLLVPFILAHELNFDLPGESEGETEKLVSDFFGV